MISYSNFEVLQVILGNSVQICYDIVSRICFKGITHPVFYGDLIYKLRRFKDATNFFSSGSRIVKRLCRLHHRADDRSCACPCTELSRSVALWLTRRWDNMTGLVQNSLEATGSWSSPLLIINRDAFSPLTWALLQFGWITACSNGCLYIFLVKTFITIDICVLFFFITSPPWFAVSPRSL